MGPEVLGIADLAVPDESLQKASPLTRSQRFGSFNGSLGALAGSVHGS